MGTVFPSPLPSANMRPNLAIEQGWIPSTLRMKILRQGSFDQPPNNVNCARMDINGEHHICIYVSIHVPMYLSMYLSMYLCVYVCIYVCIYVYHIHRYIDT